MAPERGGTPLAEIAALREEIARREHEAEALARVAQLVSETLDPAAVAGRIADGVLGLLDVHSSALRLLEPDGLLHPIALGGVARDYPGNRATIAPGDGLTGQVAREGRAMWTSDIREDDRFRVHQELRDRNIAAGIVAGLAAPLRVAGRVIGVLSVGGPTPRTFTEREVALLQTFADHAAIAIANAQSQDALARQAERLRILHEIDRALIEQQAPAAIAEAVVRPLRELLGVPRVIVNLFDLAAGTVEWLAAAGRRRVHQGPGVRYSLDLAGDLAALQRGEPQHVDVSTLPPGPDTDGLRASGIGGYIVVPMIAGGELIGSVSVGAADDTFPAEQIAIAQEAATQLAIAIAQARLHEQVKRQAAELERRVEERTRALSAAKADADRANRAKSEFLSRMSHELRTPLNAILGFAQLMELDGGTPDQKESVSQVLRAGRHLLGLINEVLDISRIEAGRLPLSLEPVPLDNTLRQAVMLVRSSAAPAGITLVVEDVDADLHVLADRQRLEQVLLNLLSNAIKYNRPQGRVTVSCAPVADNRVRVQVADTGIGIAADKLPRVFTPFDRLGVETSGVDGVGLGLALSKSLAEAMGGTLRVESEAGRGSTFSVELAVVPRPEAAVERVAASARPAEVAAAPAARTVLYVEDNPSNFRLVETVLSRRPGITLLAAIQGSVGLDLARAHRPDLILLDRHLPDISGDEVFRQLRADPRTRDIPVIVLSADAIPGRVRQLLDAGVRAYLTKPLDIHALLEAVDASLRPPDR